MLGFLIAIHTLVSVLLVTVILMQASRGGGLAGSIGGGTTQAIFGGRGAASLLSKVSTWLAVIFIGLALVISLIGTAVVSPASRSVVEEASEERTLSPGAGLSRPASENILDREE